jgi:histidinol phosphatase-like PHP family hydrolase
MANHRVDYHIHYYLDKCASSDMTLPKIDEYAHKLGIKEVAILKHYSHNVPNGEDKWANWYKIQQDQFETFLNDVNTYKSKFGIVFRTGVETELLNVDGDINIPQEAQDKIDMVALSMHHIIDMPKLPLDASHYPPHCSDHDVWIKEWDKKVQNLGAEYFVKSIVEANCNAIKRFPKVKTLSHLYDGLYMLRDYRVPVDTISDDKLIELMEPLMKCMAENNVLWELVEQKPLRPAVLHHAKTLGVKFVPTGDAHFLENGPCGNFSDYVLAQKLIEDMDLPNGCIKF